MSGDPSLTLEKSNQWRGARSAVEGNLDNEPEPAREPSSIALGLHPLLVRARAGDPAAQSELLEHFRNYLLLIANGDMDQRLKSKFGASDVVQRSLLNANQRFDQFQGESAEELRAWLRTILKNDLRKEQRQFATEKRNAQLEIKIQEESTIARGLQDGQPTPSTEAIAREKSRALQQALERLSADQRTVIRLRNFERRGFAEIGTELGKSAEAARKFWARSIEALKLELQDRSPEMFPEPRGEGLDHE